MTRRAAILIFGFLVIGVGGLIAVVARPGLENLHPSCSLPVEPVTPYIATDLEGRSFSASHLFGQPTILFFGFTFCPELCPTTLVKISRWLEKLGTDADKIKVIFVTLDPERDTPAVLKDYLNSFDKRIQGLILTPNNLAIMTKEYQVSYKKVNLGDGQYTIDHWASIFLLDPDGRVIELLSYEEPAESAIAKLRRLADGSAQDWNEARSIAGCGKKP